MRNNPAMAAIFRNFTVVRAQLLIWVIQPLVFPKSHCCHPRKRDREIACPTHGLEEEPHFVTVLYVLLLLFNVLCMSEECSV
jgi:hypothetical protein